MVESLADHGHQVTNVDRVALPGLPCATIVIDLADIGAVYDAFHQVRPEGICHLAANPSLGGFSRAETFSGNVAITYNVLQAAGDVGVTRLISAGSEMATGWLTSDKHPPRFPFDESVRIDSPNAYALSKYLSEVISDSIAIRYSKMSICTLRINNVIPPESQIEMLEPRRTNFPVPGSANYWSYIDARDVGSAFRVALEGESSGHEVYLIAAADTCIEVPIREAFNIRYGYEAEFIEGHGDFDSVFDCSKIKSHYGWEATHSWRDSAK